MAARGLTMGLVMALVVLLSARTMAQSTSGCTSVIINLAPCLSYVSGSSSTPSSSCCTKLASVVQSQPVCLCSLLNGGGSSFGVSINQTLALELPAACNVQTPPVSRCNDVNAPADSPEGMPDDQTPSSSPVTGSKATPATGGSSVGVNVNSYFQFIVLLAMVVASYAVTGKF